MQGSTSGTEDACAGRLESVGVLTEERRPALGFRIAGTAALVADEELLLQPTTVLPFLVPLDRAVRRVRREMSR